MYLDQRQHYLERLRYVLQAAAYPVQLAVNSPPAAWSAEGILITDPEHGTPVRIERTGLRTIAVGAGDATSLALPYLPANADIKQGDLLVTSGLGGVFPHGYPVARVTEVHREAVQPLAQVRAAPLAHIGTDSEVVLVWFRPDHPAAPAPQAASVNGVKAGNAALQPQAAPPRPTAAPAPAMPKPAPEAARTPPRTGPAPRPKPATEPAPEAEATSPAEGPPPAVESPESKPRDPAVPQPETQPPKGNR